jgi:putative two-component system response regulator
MININEKSKQKTLLIVDDESINLHAIKQILQNDYRLLFAMDGRTAIQISKEAQPDLILLDIMLPDVSGLDVCATLKQDSKTAKIPIIFVSSMTDTIDEAHGFEVGAVDYITKPVRPAVVRARVANHLRLVRTEELQETRLQIIQRLGRAAEYKDNETGLHVIRMSLYSKLLALAAGFSEETADNLLHAAPMHDIGKIGIPDHILLKPGKLDEAEWEVMRRHPEIGLEIIGEHESELLLAAATIALTHHEKWDGSGYPNGLKGDEIPLIGRIVAVADVFDALTSERPYKNAWSVENALTYMQNESGKHFDPDLISLFIEILPSTIEVMNRWSEKSRV